MYRRSILILLFAYSIFRIDAAFPFTLMDDFPTYARMFMETDPFYFTSFASFPPFATATFLPTFSYPSYLNYMNSRPIQRTVHTYEKESGQITDTTIHQYFPYVQAKLLSRKLFNANAARQRHAMKKNKS
ncbi:hypothetical protein DICVIV_01431 [Dictyocaulus viviparus]|uniref:Uncharacterized protein n=1 Tax=Dictyocaulus viviparus TaxID=29172 RepID=A0A0D8Y8N2_DICVI|nr:hypothetical protein DICVIV_01431 [Dictyocaulus viviparus]